MSKHQLKNNNKKILHFELFRKRVVPKVIIKSSCYFLVTMKISPIPNYADREKFAFPKPTQSDSTCYPRRIPHGKRQQRNKHNFFPNIIYLKRKKKKKQKQRESRIYKSDYIKLLYSCTCIDVHKSVDLGGRCVCTSTQMWALNIFK